MIFLIFIIIPIIEISIFITVGSNIGILNTIAIILLTAMVGIFLVRRRGLSLLFSARQNMHDGVMPTNEIKGGIFLLISGLLLITPGFFTDCIGFAIFLKPVQDFISQHAKIILSQELEGINVSICPTKSKSAVTCLLSLGFSMLTKGGINLFHSGILSATE